MVSLITKIFKTLSWRMTILYIATLFFAVVGYTAYEMRDHVLSPLLRGPQQNASMTFSTSKGTEREIQEAMKDLPWVAGVAVMSADLRLNEARTILFVPRSEEFSQLSIKKYPIFSNLEESNIAAISLINGEFSCGSYAKTPISALAPRSDVKSVCRISIPSYYGYFSGFITIFLDADPDETQREQIKLVFSSVSISIYFKDVLSTQRALLGNKL